MRYQRALQAVTMAAVAALAPHGAEYLTDTATDADPPSEIAQAAVEVDVEPCGGVGDVFQLDVPGTYTAFAIGSSGSLMTEVWGGDSELLASSHPTTATVGAVDLLSGLRFGIAAPQVFEVESAVSIRVNHENSPYELLLVRIGSTPQFSHLDVRPPVERLVNETGSCPIGGSSETFKIHTNAVYSDTGARQVFVIDSPNGLAVAESRSGGSTDRHCPMLKAWRSLNRGHLLYGSRFFAIR